MKHAARQSMLKPRLGELIITGICAFAFAVALTYRANDGVCELSLHLILEFVILWVFFLFAFIGGRYFLERPPGNQATGRSTPERFIAFLDGTGHPALIAGLVILICWIPYIVLLFPGVSCFDTKHMLAMYASPADGFFTAHHPVFDTLLFGTIILTVANITGSAHAGLFAYSILQCAGTALAFGRVTDFAGSSLGISHNGRFLMVLFFGLFPLFPLFSLYISKDSLFSLFFVLFIVEFIHLVVSQGKSLDRPSKLIALLVLSILCCATKKLGVYVVVGSLLIFVIALRRHWVKPLISAVVCAALMFGVYPIATSAAGIAPGGMQEMLSVPFQQTARCAFVYPEDATDEERAVINALLGYDTLADRYQYDSADPIKGYQELADHSTDEFTAYIKTWLAQGIRHPLVYLDAFAALNSPWFSFEFITPMFDYGESDEFNEQGIGADFGSHSGLFQRLSWLTQDLYYFLLDIPIVNALFTMGLWASLLPAFSLAVLLRKPRQRFIVALVPIMISIALGLWLAPTATGIGNGIRYLIPIIYTMPALLCLCRSACRDEYK